MQSHAAIIPARILTKVSISLFDYCMSMHDHCLTNVKIPFLLSVTGELIESAYDIFAPCDPRGQILPLARGMPRCS